MSRPYRNLDSRKNWKKMNTTDRISLAAHVLVKNIGEQYFDQQVTIHSPLVKFMLSELDMMENRKNKHMLVCFITRNLISIRNAATTNMVNDEKGFKERNCDFKPKLVGLSSIDNCSPVPVIIHNDITSIVSASLPSPKELTMPNLPGIQCLPDNEVRLTDAPVKQLNRTEMQDNSYQYPIKLEIEVEEEKELESNPRKDEQILLDESYAFSRLQYTVVKMKCSILGCNTVYEGKGNSLSFHGFPNSPYVLSAWVAATGIADFIPTHRSKVCGKHFEESAFIDNTNKLKPGAVPIKFLTEDALRRVNVFFRKNDGVQESKPMTRILSADTQLKQFNSVSTSSKTFIISSTGPPRLTLATSRTIKVVDVNKLLQPQAQKIPTAVHPITTGSSPLNTHFNHHNYSKDCIKYTSEPFVNRTGITASQVLTCLRAILPGKFDLTRMIPNDKVAQLILRYLKLDESNQHKLNAVKDYLKLIIEAVKAKDNRSIEFTKHMYNKINDRDLKRALAFILPENFSIIDINNELLGLLCITMKVPIYSDAYHILIKKIRKFTSEGQKFSEILNIGNEVYDASLEFEKNPEINGRDENVTESSGITVDKSELINENSEENDIIYIGGKTQKLLFVDVDKDVEIKPEATEVKPLSPKGITQLTKSHPTNKPFLAFYESSSDNEENKHYKRKRKPKEDLDWEPDEYEETPPLCQRKTGKSLKRTRTMCQPSTDRLYYIVLYLQEKNISARTALIDKIHKVNMLRFLNLPRNKPNMKEVAINLKYIMSNNLNMTNITNHLSELRLRRHTPLSEQQKSSLIPSVKHDVKLKMKPVVVLQDVLDHGVNQLLFMNKKKMKSNGFYNQIPVASKQSPSNKKYSTEQVRKLTEDSYKQFRRIIMKRDGNRAVFRVKYCNLEPGTVVYAKNYRHPGVGWVRGVVSKMESALKYQIQLDNNVVWRCTVDQLRPLLNKVAESVDGQRSQRPIKPKQLFDL